LIVPRWLKRILAVGVALLLSGPFCFDAIDEGDIGWHLALGRLISQSGIPFRNALTWTTPNEPWYPTSWLYDWLAERVTVASGVVGLQAFHFLLLALALIGVAFAAERVERRTGVWVAPILGLLLIARYSERPHVATWVVIAWVLFLCVPDTEQRTLRGRARSDATWRRRLWCLPLIALGSNLHSGAAFATGVLALFCLEAFLLGGRQWRDLVLAACGGLALLANPGGFFNVAYIIKHLSVQDVVQLDEFKAPTFASEAPFFVLAPIVFVLAWRLRRDLPALLVALGVFGVLGFRAIRAVFEFDLIAVLSLPVAFAWAWDRWGARGAAALVTACVTILIAARMPFFMQFEASSEWNELVLPVRAVEFVRHEKLDGKLFNGFEDGGYVEWALPEVPAFQDARVQAFPPEFFAQQEKAEASPEAFRQWLREWNVEWALVTRRPMRNSGYRKLDAPDWALVYWDETSEIFIRRDVTRFAKVIERFEYRYFHAYGNPVAGLSAASRDELTQRLAELDRFQSTALYLPEAWLVRCGVLRRLGMDTSRACAVAEGVANTDRRRQLLALVQEMTVATQ
jgi:hypothetical protein